MQIIDFTAAHIEQAVKIAKQNYEEERGHCPALPPVEKLPELMPFAENNLGVAAFDGDSMLGFMCSIPLFERPFQIPNVMGAYVPLHAHGATHENWAKIYAAMYETAADKWLKAGATNHAITLYAHDTAAQTQFFQYRFGLNGIDAILEIDRLNTESRSGFEYAELQPDEFGLIWPLHNLLLDHFQQSPMYVIWPRYTMDDFLKTNENNRYFVAKTDSDIIAYMKLSKHGETFVSNVPDVMNICGAYLLPEYRGKGVFNALLGHAAAVLAKEGYKRLGVDFESFNPSGSGFWLKHFTAYTHSVVRRIDESAIKTSGDK